MKASLHWGVHFVTKWQACCPRQMPLEQQTSQFQMKDQRVPLVQIRTFLNRNDVWCQSPLTFSATSYPGQLTLLNPKVKIHSHVNISYPWSHGLDTILFQKWKATIWSYWPLTSDLCPDMQHCSQGQTVALHHETYALPCNIWPTCHGDLFHNLLRSRFCALLLHHLLFGKGLRTCYIAISLHIKMGRIFWAIGSLLSLSIHISTYFTWVDNGLIFILDKLISLLP